MSEVASAAALAVTAAGVLTLLAAPVCGLAAAMRLALEFWTAAALLHLTGSPSWSTLGVTAVIVGIRRLVLVGNPFARVMDPGSPARPG